MTQWLKNCTVSLNLYILTITFKFTRWLLSLLRNTSFIQLLNYISSGKKRLAYTFFSLKNVICTFITSVWCGLRRYWYRIVITYPDEMKHRNGRVQCRRSDGWRQTGTCGIVTTTRRVLLWEQRVCRVAATGPLHRGHKHALQRQDIDCW